MKESRFFQIGPHWPPSYFWCAILKNTNLSSSSFHFSAGFYIKIKFWVGWFYRLFEWDWREKTMFIHTDQPLITYIWKRNLFCCFRDESALIRNFLCNGRVIVNNTSIIKKNKILARFQINGTDGAPLWTYTIPKAATTVMGFLSKLYPLKLKTAFRG